MEDITIHGKMIELASAEGADGAEYVKLYEVRLPWNCDLLTDRFFIVRHCCMDVDEYCWDHLHNDLKHAYDEFSREARKTVRFGGEKVKRPFYGKIKYSDDWYYYREELIDDEEESGPSSTSGDYGPGNPWDAPGMKMGDFM